MNTLEILDHFERRHDAMIAAIATSSISNRRRITFIKARLSSDRIVEMFRELPLELSVEREYAEGVGDHLLVRAFPSAEKSVLLLGHTDTVHPIGTNKKTRRGSKTAGFTAAAFST